jgi:N-acetylneuraminate synthase/N,N'-diacetyllegionaminate synthase
LILKKVRIGDKRIGQGEPCFIVAEAGVNHNGEIRLAKRMINAAKKAGAAAIKFQIFSAECLVAKMAPKAAYQRRTTGKGSQYEMLKKLELKEDEFRKLAAYAKRKNIIFLASAFDENGVELLDELRVPAFKVPSSEITNFLLLKQIAMKRKPIILSTGMSTLGEIAEALEVIRKDGSNEIVLLHCLSDYPAKVEEMNLRAMNTLKEAFGLPVGLSDHTLSLDIPIAAAALGAKIIEKHFTLNRGLPGPDQKASLEPDELRKMIARIREVERALGDGTKKPTKSEEILKKVVRRSIVARTDIIKGTVITVEMLDLKRPGTGLEPKHLGKVIGRKARIDIMADELITFEKLV